MTVILTHGDGDGICSAALIKMVPMYKNAEVFFTHPMGIVHDLRKIEDDVIICDIAVDIRAHSELYEQLMRLVEQQFNVMYFDHHTLPGDLPEEIVLVYDKRVCATELVYRYFYYKLPHNASRIALIGAINDYMDKTHLMSELMYHYERRSLFLDAGILAQGISAFGRDYNGMRRLVEEMGNGKYPVELKNLVKNALNTTRNDKYAQKEVLKHYKTGNHMAWVKNPSASRSKAAHWIMGDAGKVIGITVLNHHSRPDMADLTIRGRGKVDLREIVPKIAMKMGGSGGGHPNACGCRIPMSKLDIFLQILDSTLGALRIENGKTIENLLDLDRIIH